jgi:hypothetical protein
MISSKAVLSKFKKLLTFLWVQFSYSASILNCNL